MAAWVAALIGLAGVVLGAILTPLTNFITERTKQRTEWKREALQQQLEELYRPLYENYVIMPKQDPEHYFSEWEDEEFSRWLSGAVNVMMPKLHLLPDEVLEKIPIWRETLGYSHASEIEREVKWLYKHIKYKFLEIRRQLYIS